MPDIDDRVGYDTYFLLQSSHTPNAASWAPLTPIFFSAVHNEEEQFKGTVYRNDPNTSVRMVLKSYGLPSVLCI